jgi:phage shock protein C
MEQKRLYRSKKNEVIAGVCGGIGEYFDVDPTIIRIIFIILTIWGGVGVILYIIGMLVIPYQGQEAKESRDEAKEKIKEAGKKVEAVASDIRDELKSKKGHPDGGIYLGLIIILLGVMFLLRRWFSWFDFEYLWPLFLILIGILIITSGKRKGDK